MVRGCRAAIWALMLVILATFAQTALAAKGTGGSDETEWWNTPPAYTEAQAKAYVKEMLPLVEQAAGRKFKITPVVKVVTPDDLYPIMRKEVTPRIQRMFPTLSKDQARSMADSMASLYSECCLGKYGTITERLYLLPRNVRPILRLCEASQKYEQQIVKLVVAHELAHALQDQYIGITRQENSLDTVEKQLAYTSTIEGFGMFVENSVADTLKMDAAAKQLALLISTGSYKGMDPVDKVSAQQVMGAVSDMYLRGQDFVSWHFGKGGLDQVWSVLAHPPIYTSMIYHPEAYRADAKPKQDYAPALKELEKMISKRKWTTVTQALGEMELRAYNAGMDAGDMDALIGGTEQIYETRATADGVSLHIDLMMLKEKSSAPTIISAAENLARADVAKMSESKKYKFTPCAPADFNAMKGKADVARRFSYAVSIGDSSYSCTYVSIARGRIVMEIYTGGFTVPDSRIAAVFEELWKRLPAEVR